MNSGVPNVESLERIKNTPFNRLPTVEIERTPDLRKESSPRSLELTARFTHLNPAQATILTLVAQRLPSVLANARANHNTANAWRLRQLHLLPDEVVDQLIARSWESRRQLIELAKQTAVIEFTEAKRRCKALSCTLPACLIHLSYGGRVYYPAFQFEADGRPSVCVKGVLHLFDTETDFTDVENMHWFLSPNPNLDAARPADCLTSKPAAVRKAAQSRIDGAT